MTAPVAITFTRSAPPCSTRRTALRTSSTESATPSAQVARHDGVDVGRQAGDVAATAGAGDVRPGARASAGPSTQPASIASRSATSTNARNVPTSRTVVNPAQQRVPRVAHAGQRLLRARAREQLGVAVAAVGLADQVRVAVDQAGQQRVAGQVDRSAAPSAGASADRRRRRDRSPSTTTARSAR